MLRQAPPPEQWSWDSPDPPPEPKAKRTLAPEDDFRRTVLLTIAGTAVPGLGLIAARRVVVGSVILGLFATSILALVIYGAVDRQALLALAVNPEVLRGIGVGLVVIGFIWVGVVIASHLALRGRVSPAQRATGGVLVGILAFTVAAPLAVASRYSYEQASLVGTVFKTEKQSKSATRPTLNATTEPNQPTPKDPWESKPRLNILLLGGDADRGRIGTRTDTVILASINTQTGNTTLFSLPRNTARMPFPAHSPLHKYYPYGFTNGDGQNAEYFLNAMYMNVPNNVPKDVLGETDNLGADALKLSVGEALGLKVDYYVLINLQGFSKLINALGGIRVNVNTYVPIGGNTDRGIPPEAYISPGPNKHLDGKEALWFARGRYGSDDYARMDRQRCVVNAIIRQANPANVLSRYEDIAKAGKQIVLTDMPQEVLPLIVELSLRVKEGNVRSIVFKNGVSGFISSNPDYETVRKRVKIAFGETKNIKSSTASPKPSATASHKSNTQRTESEDVNASCAFDPKVAATSRPVR
ncbi:MAG TPA: LCP family protein [Propionibacteriaceae bacterium]|nr:LCP family protein [Propionibacteriaceae bacterium]